MTARPDWSVARLAREAGIHRSTIFGWIKDGGEGLTVASIRAVATALGDSVENAAAAALDLDDRDYDQEIATIQAEEVSDRIKDQLVHYLVRRRAEDEQRRRTELAMLMEQLRQAG